MHMTSFLLCADAHTDLLDIYYKEANLLFLETYQLSNIGDTSATTHSTLSLGTKRTRTPLLSTSSPKRQKPTPQQGIKSPPMRPLAPKKSTKVHKAAVATVPKQNDIRTFFSKKARTDVADTMCIK